MERSFKLGNEVQGSVVVVGQRKYLRSSFSIDAAKMFSDMPGCTGITYRGIPPGHKIYDKNLHSGFRYMYFKPTIHSPLQRFRGLPNPTSLSIRRRSLRTYQFNSCRHSITQQRTLRRHASPTTQVMTQPNAQTLMAEVIVFLPLNVMFRSRVCC